MPSYVFTYRQPKGQPLNMDQADAWWAWFEKIGEHITQQGSAVSAARQLGNCDGSQSVSGFTVISARDMDHALAIAQDCPAIGAGQGIEIGELLEIPAAA
ncbi:MAG TPA: hypothetical protein VHU61_14650 [Solirubrobacteraceae bacterium]|jgi:hypothetical protein|nr:hypothetical protein [Solirubrobacteraceae bacterium]